MSIHYLHTHIYMIWGSCVCYEIRFLVLLLLLLVLFVLWASIGFSYIYNFKSFEQNVINYKNTRHNNKSEEVLFTHWNGSCCTNKIKLSLKMLMNGMTKIIHYVHPTHPHTHASKELFSNFFIQLLTKQFFSAHSFIYTLQSTWWILFFLHSRHYSKQFSFHDDDQYNFIYNNIKHCY